jgi:hypothetical protein
VQVREGVGMRVIAIRRLGMVMVMVILILILLGIVGIVTGMNTSYWNKCRPVATL